MKTIGFIGVGVMGKPMVRNLMKKGFPVSIYTRTKSKVLDVIEEGAVWCDDVKTCVQDKDVIITIVGYPKDVEEVYFGENGIIANAKPGAVLIDMTTTSPKLSERIYAEAKPRGISALDAPVSGGDSGAKAGTLSIMVGGDREAFDACQDVFAAMGTNIIYEGGAGKGQHTKMANQIALAGAVASVSEAIAYARRTGLDVETMLASISKGAAGSWQNLTGAVTSRVSLTDAMVSDVSVAQVLTCYFVEVDEPLLQFGPLTITLKPLIAVTLLGFALCLAVLALRKKPLAVLAGPALVWVLNLAAPVSWMVLSKAHAYVHVHLVPMLWHFALVPVSCALLVWLVKTAITAVKE